MQFLFRSVLRHRKLVLLGYLLAAVCAVFAAMRVKVNSDLASYLPKDAPSTVSLRVMEEAFGGDIPNARLMVKGISFEDALAFEEEIRGMEGVRSASFVSMADYLGLPAAQIPESMREASWRNGNALYTLTMDNEAKLDALEKIRAASGHETAVSGSFADAKTAQANSARELFTVVGVVVVFGICLLLLTLPSWLEPFLLVACLMTAVLLNAGTNLLFGTVSAVTNTAASVLQMGVSVDYFIFLIHRYREYQDKGLPEEEAMAQAMLHSGPSILSSALTTVIGFLALTAMRYRIGLDMGLVLSKGILISLVCAFTLLPCVLLSCGGAIRRTSHRVPITRAAHIASLSEKLRRPLLLLFLAALIPAFLLQGGNDFWFGASHSYKDSHSLMRERAEIEEAFGLSNQMVLLVPEEELAEQAAMEEALMTEIGEITSILSWPSAIQGTLLELFIPPHMKGMLISGGYSRSVLTLSLPEESEETFAAIDRIREIAAAYFGDSYYLAGASVSTRDLKAVISSDSLKVNLIALGAIFLVLLFTFRSFAVPLILSLTIEGGIWISMGMPNLAGSTLFYIGWLIVSSILLGFTVDYAILLTTRYREKLRSLPGTAAAAPGAVLQMPAASGQQFTEVSPPAAVVTASALPDGMKNTALRESISGCAVSILTSGLIMTVAGLLLGIFCTNQIIAQVGVLLAVGTVTAMAAVLLVLPGALMLPKKL